MIVKIMVNMMVKVMVKVLGKVVVDRSQWWSRWRSSCQWRWWWWLWGLWPTKSRTILYATVFVVFFISLWMCESHSSVFLLIVNVQISQFCFSSHCECANLQSPSFVRDPINSGSEASLGAKTSHTWWDRVQFRFLCKKSYCQIKGNFYFLHAPKLS